MSRAAVDQARCDDEGESTVGRLWIVSAQRPPSRRGRATRSKVLAASRLLFRERYFDEVTLADIAEASGLSVGTFYSYFANKESVFFELLSHAFVEMYEEARRGWRPGSDYRESVRSTTLSYMKAYYANRQVMRSAYYLAATNPRAKELLRTWRKDLEEQMRKRLIQDQGASSVDRLDPAILIRVLQCMVDEYVRRAYADEEFGVAGEDDIAAAAEVLAEVWYRAIFGSEKPKIRHGANKSARGINDSHRQASRS